MQKFYNITDTEEQSLLSLSGARRWVFYKGGLDDTGKLDKRPCNARTGGFGKSDTPATWTTRAAAEKAALAARRRGRKPGVGIVLGDLENGHHLAGVDLDGCLVDGEPATWARDIIDRFGSYVEVSPSGTGLKLFFIMSDQTAAAARNMIDGKSKRSWMIGPHEGAELHLSHIYYTVTGDEFATDPRRRDMADLIGSSGELRTVRRSDLKWLIEEAGPRLIGDETERGRDESGSGELFRLAARIKGEGGTRADFEAAIPDHRLASDHVRRNGKRALQRAWERAPDYRQTLLDLFEDLPPEEPNRASGLTFLSPGECVEGVRRDYVVKGLLAPGDVGCIVGAPGVGKSLLAPYLAYRVAQGDRAFDLRTKPATAFYVASEDESGMRGRVTALRRRYGDADGFKLVCGVSDLLRPKSPDLVALGEAVKRERPGLIIIDTLAMAFPGLEENDAAGMGRVVKVARHLARWGAAVLVVHHDTKEGDGLPRGHSLLNGALDLSIHLQRDGGMVFGQPSKNRNGSCDTRFAFAIEKEVLGTDDDGDEVTAAVCCEAGAEFETRPAKISPSGQAALELIVDALESSGRRRMSEEEWRALAVDGRTVSASEKYNTRHRAFKRAVEELTRHGRVEFRNGFFKVKNARDESIREEFDDE